MKPHTVLSLVVACLLLVSPSLAQKRKEAKQPVSDSRADAYYHFALGHLYSELAGQYGNRSEYLDNAIDNYREALKADPDADFLAEELSNLYIQAGRLREGVEEAKAAIEKDPSDTNARRILGRIYLRLIGDRQQNRLNEEMVERAIEQYTKLSELLPADTEVWLVLGRLHKLAQDSNASEAAFEKVLEIDPNQEDALIGLAMVYSDLGDQPRAAEMLRRVVASNPSIRTLTALARSYEQQNEPALAAEVYRQAHQMDPESTRLKQSLAQNLMYSNKLDEALRLFEEVVAEEPEDYTSHLRISQIHNTKGEFAKSWEALKKAKEGSPDNLEVLYHEVNLLESSDRASDAIARLNEILDGTKKDTYSNGERSNRAVFLERLGLLLRANERYDEAVQRFEELKDLDPDLEARVLAQIGDTLRQGKQYEKAADVLESAHRKHPDNRMVSVVRATVLADLGKTDEAVAAIEELTEGKNDLDNYLTRAQIYEKTKSFGKMAAVIEEALKIATTDAEKSTVLFMQGAMYERRKLFDEAEASFRKVLAINPKNSSAMNYLGYMFADQNMKLEEALELISKALEAEPQNGAYLDSLGWVYYRMDRLEEAAENLERAVKKVASDPVVHDHLGDVYSKQGKLKEAITHWRKSLDEWASSPSSEKDPSQVAKIEKKLEGALVRLARESSAAKP